MVRVATLTRPNLSASCFRFGTKEHGLEREYKPSYESLLEGAKVLAGARSPLYQDAYHMLNFAIECFMKYLFCVIREGVFRNQSPEEFVSTIPPFYRRVFTKRHQNLEAGSFGHDIVGIMDEIMAISDLKNFDDFGDLKKELNSDRTSWVPDRYKIRQHGNYKKKYERRLRRFETLLSGSLSGLA